MVEVLILRSNDKTSVKLKSLNNSLNNEEVVILI